MNVCSPLTNTICWCSFSIHLIFSVEISAQSYITKQQMTEGGWNRGKCTEQGQYATRSQNLTSDKAWKSLVKDCVWWVVLVWSLSWPYLRLAKRFRLSCQRCLWLSSLDSSSPKNSLVSFFTYLQHKISFSDRCIIHTLYLLAVQLLRERCGNLMTHSGQEYLWKVIEISVY